MSFLEAAGIENGGPAWMSPAPPVAPQPSHAPPSHRSVLDRSMNILGLMKHLLRRDESANMPKNIFPGRGTPRVVERKPDRSVNIFRVTRVEREVKLEAGRQFQPETELGTENSVPHRIGTRGSGPERTEATDV